MAGPARVLRRRLPEERQHERSVRIVRDLELGGDARSRASPGWGPLRKRSIISSRRPGFGNIVAMMRSGGPHRRRLPPGSRTIARGAATPRSSTRTLAADSATVCATARAYRAARSVGDVAGDDGVGALRRREECSYQRPAHQQVLVGRLLLRPSPARSGGRSRARALGEDVQTQRPSSSPGRHL